MSQLAILDLFSGIGGFSLGLERTGGFRTVGFCEVEPYARAVLARHWPGVPCFPDVRDLGRGQLDAAGVGPVDVVCGGFPCQDISLAGKGAGLAGERSGLWFEFARIIAETRPRFVIAENVSALRSRGLDTVLGSLAALGYDAEWHCIPASAVGAPHRRDRVWIVAYPQHGGELDRPRQAGREAGERAAERFGPGRDGSPRDADDVADANTQHRRSEPHQPLRSGRGAWAEPGGCGPHVADAQGIYWRPGLRERGTILNRTITPDSSWWLAEPDVGRVADGVPSRVDRLRCLGNAVVPQIPEIIGRAILASFRARPVA